VPDYYVAGVTKKQSWKSKVISPSSPAPYQRGTFASTLVVAALLNSRNRRMSISTGPLRKRFSQILQNNSATK
jgi:hypothetical protein